MNSQEKKKDKLIKLLKQFWLNHETKIVLVAGFVLVAVISFEAGILKGRDWQQKPLIIEKPAQIEAIAAESQNHSQSQNLTTESLKNTDTEQNTPQSCAFMGSKNSDKYHLPTCRWAKQIKPENQVCFSSAEDAQSKGYQPDKNCVK